MQITGHALYHDGQTPRGTQVNFVLSEDTLDLIGLDGTRVTRWPKASLQRLSATPGQARLACRDHPDARLEIADPASARELAQALADLRDGSKLTARTVLITGGLILAAVLSVAGVIVFGIPAVAAQLAPIVPTGLEIAIGEQVRPQIIRALSHGSTKGACADPAGIAALTKATAPLIAAANTGLPIHIDVVDVAVPNAFALPGGNIVVLRGLLDRVAGPDEFLGVLAHELGHVTHRDAMRQLIETTGLTAVVSAVIGDYTGSTIGVLVGRSLISLSYSRDVEANADTFAVAVLTRMGRNPATLGRALQQMTAGTANSLASLPWLSTHPSTPERIARLEASGTDVTPAPIIDPEEWASLKAICR